MMELREEHKCKKTDGACPSDHCFDKPGVGHIQLSHPLVDCWASAMVLISYSLLAIVLIVFCFSDERR